ncbi:MAG: alpha/beta hydrolase [Gemmatimonadota bacterium]|nr:MAG: alpha/beta hydrolase [Gemmatimonadota bacterium]
MHRLLAATTASALVFIATATPAQSQGSEEPAYDAQLSTYAYPHEVRKFALDSQGHPLEMAYMDVAPTDEPNGRTVLLLHGKNFSGAYWADTIVALTGLGYRVIAPDQIGFGKSSKPEHYQFTFQALATNTQALLDARGVDRVDVVGHSMGGMLATRFALMFPAGTGNLVLVNPIGLYDWKREVPYLTVDDWYRSELRKTPEGVKEYMTQSYFDGVWKGSYQPLVEIQQGWIRGGDYPRIAWNSALTYDMIFTQPVLYEFDQLQVPTLLIIGQRDKTALGKPLVDEEVAAMMGDYSTLDEKAAAAIPNATLVELEGVGHVPQFESWDEYIHALTEFLGGSR